MSSNNKQDKICLSLLRPGKSGLQGHLLNYRTEFDSRAEGRIGKNHKALCKVSDYPYAIDAIKSTHFHMICVTISYLWHILKSPKVIVCSNQALCSSLIEVKSPSKLEHLYSKTIETF